MASDHPHVAIQAVNPGDGRPARGMLLGSSSIKTTKGGKIVLQFFSDGGITTDGQEIFRIYPESKCILLGQTVLLNCLPSVSKYRLHFETDSTDQANSLFRLINKIRADISRGKLIGRNVFWGNGGLRVSRRIMDRLGVKK
jgi:hypothetical protein